MWYVLAVYVCLVYTCAVVWYVNYTTSGVVAFTTLNCAHVYTFDAHVITAVPFAQMKSTEAYFSQHIRWYERIVCHRLFMCDDKRVDIVYGVRFFEPITTNKINDGQPNDIYCEWCFFLSFCRLIGLFIRQCTLCWLNRTICESFTFSAKTLLLLCELNARGYILAESTLSIWNRKPIHLKFMLVNFILNLLVEECCRFIS